MSLFHKHQWRVDRAYYRFYYSGTHTMLSIQCETCANVKEHTAAKVPMTPDQVNNYCFAKFNQALNCKDNDRARRVREDGVWTR